MHTYSLVLVLLSTVVGAQLSGAQTTTSGDHGQPLWLIQRSYLQLNDKLKASIASDSPEENFRFAHYLLAAGNNDTLGPALELFVKLGELKELYGCDEEDIEWLTKNQEALVGVNKQERVYIIFNLMCRLHAIRCQEDYEHNFAMLRIDWELEQQNRIENVMNPFIWQIQQNQEELIKQAQNDKRQRELLQQTTIKSNGGLERSSDLAPSSSSSSSPSITRANKKNKSSNRANKQLINSPNATWSLVSDPLIDSNDKSPDSDHDTQEHLQGPGMKRQSGMKRKHLVAEQISKKLNIGITKRMIMSNKYRIDKVKGSKLLWSSLSKLAKQNQIEFEIKSELDRNREKAIIQRFVRQQVEQPCERFYARFASLFPVAKFDLKYNARPSSKNEQFYWSFAQYELCESFLKQKSVLLEKIANFALDDIVLQTIKQHHHQQVSSDQETAQTSSSSRFEGRRFLNRKKRVDHKIGR